MTQILARKRKNNPILLGEPGVGKTAIAEGLARAVVTRTNADGSPLPEFLIGKRVMQLDVGLLMAGAKVGADPPWLALAAGSRGPTRQATLAPSSSCIPPLTTCLTCSPACPPVATSFFPSAGARRAGVSRHPPAGRVPLRGQRHPHD